MRSDMHAVFMKKMITRISKCFNNNYLRMFLGGMLLYMIIILPFLVHHDGYFFYYGDYNVQQVPFYILAHRAVREGYFFWNPNIDLGSSMGGSFAFYLWGSPFFWFTIPFPEKWLPYMMPFLMAMKYGTAMTTSYAWIRTQTKSEWGARIGALLYAFSGFQACNIVFQHFHDVTAFFPLYLLCFDRAVREKKWTGFTLMTALMSVINYYFFFGQVIFIVIYYFVRFGLGQPVRKTLQQVIGLLANGALGLGISAFFLVQSLSGIIGNSRLENQISGLDMILYKDKITPLSIVKSFFMMPDIIARGTLFTNETVKNASLAGYLPCFALAGVIAYYLTGVKSRKTVWKRRFILVCAVMAFVPVLNSLFSALNEAYYARWFYMPLLIMACMTAEILERNNDAALRKGTAAAAAVTVILLAASIFPSYKNGKLSWFSLSEYPDLMSTQVIVTTLLLGLLLAVVFLIRPYAAKKRIAKRLITAVTVISCAVTSIGMVSNGDSLIAYTGGVKWHEQMLENTPELPEYDRFARIETDNTSTNYDMVWGYSSIHCFQSTVNPSVFSFYLGIGMRRTVESTLPMERVGARALLSMKYYLENTYVKPSATFEEKGGLTGYSYASTSDKYSIYMNEHSIPMGFTFDHFVTDTLYDTFVKSGSADRMLVRDIILTQEQKEKYGDLLEEDTGLVTDLMDDEVFLAECDARAKTACTSFAFDRTGFFAETTLERDNLVFFSVPYDKGFKAYVDGAQTQIERVNYGLMAVYVPAGTHTIEFKYLPYGFVPAAAISVLCTGVVILLFMRRRKKNQVFLAMYTDA